MNNNMCQIRIQFRAEWLLQIENRKEGRRYPRKIAKNKGTLLYCVYTIHNCRYLGRNCQEFLATSKVGVRANIGAKTRFSLDAEAERFCIYYTNR